MRTIDDSFIDELATYRDTLFSTIQGLIRFPMRMHPRPYSHKARIHEKYVHERFTLKQNNLFAYSINPDKYSTLHFEDSQQDYYLYKLFILNEPLPRTLVCELIDPEIVSLLLKSKICVLTNTYIKSLFRVIPFHNQLYLTDRYDRTNEYMVYLSYDSLFMASYLLSKTSQYQHSDKIPVVDIGCGSGILGLCLNDEKYTIHGIDINPRAIQCAQINSRLNGIKETAFWIQDLKELEILQRSFRLLVFNPPFVFMPKTGNPLASFGGHYGVEASLNILSYLNKTNIKGNESLGIVQSPILYRQEFPLLVEKSQQFSNLAMHFEIVGEMPPFKKYQDFYRKHNVEKIVIMAVRSTTGSGISLTKNLDCMKKYCFG